jgi:hypothetical protein
MQSRIERLVKSSRLRAIQPTVKPISTSFSSLLGPGKHPITSPVLASRAHELTQVSKHMMRNPLLKEFGMKIYDFRYRLIIPAQYRAAANQFSRECFLNYIGKYSHHGITEDNIVDWVSSEAATGANRSYVQGEMPHQYAYAKVESDNGFNNIDKGFFSPPHIIAYHEVMHVEEMTKAFFRYSYGRETLTTLKSLLLLDEVNKKIKDVSLNKTIHYGRNVNINGNHIPLGKLINFFRFQEKVHANLSHAVVSDETSRFLMK